MAYAGCATSTADMEANPEEPPPILSVSSRPVYRGGLSESFSAGMPDNDPVGQPEGFGYAAGRMGPSGPHDDCESLRNKLYGFRTVMDPDVTKYNRGSQCVTVGDMVNPLNAFTQLAGEVREARACASKVNPLFEKTTAQKPWYRWKCYAREDVGGSRGKKKSASVIRLYAHSAKEPRDGEMDSGSSRSEEWTRTAA